MHFPGKKTKHIFDGLIERNLPSNLGDFTYVEPFGGTFGIGNIIRNHVKKTVYNDIVDYAWVSEIVKADVIHQLDYLEIIKMYDSPTTLFYFDPPYFEKEYAYDLEHSPEFHQNLCEAIKNLKGKFILSYEDNSTIFRMYKGYQFDFYDGDKKSLQKEMLITNV